ncbi:Cd(II)/Pb(II)-responsive transcriptional regulator [Pseudomonas sp. FME51]|uniref:Cd(II)/Pb(II)-responsive transcriptional regulator n=1 Tax=Pseudomonas sp. FME51 TaxID=2742609 RepID=UPI001866D903|nr:Cd(II)/Pb(II)-responsive transcriptional regulator [Pseudomonas sp. FME51]
MRIGELARKTGCKTVTIRYYEQAGLLPVPQRSEGNYRVYTQSHAARLLFIRNCRALDMTLDEVRRLLDYRDNPDQDCGGVNVLVDEHIEHVAARIEELKALSRQLIELRSHCAAAREAADCQILQQLTASEQQADVEPTSHVGRSHGGIFQRD